MKRAALNPSVIAENAAALADEAGLEAVTMSAVARRLGVQAPSLYSHVRDHAALLDGITVIALAGLAERIAEATAGRAGRDALAGFAGAHRAYSQLSPGRWQALQRRAGAAAVGSAAARHLVSLTDSVLTAYNLPAAQRVHAIRFIGSTITGFLALERVGNFDHSDPGAGESWLRVVDGLDSLLALWSTNPHKEGTPS